MYTAVKWAGPPFRAKAIGRGARSLGVHGPLEALGDTVVRAVAELPIPSASFWHPAQMHRLDHGLD